MKKLQISVMIGAMLALSSISMAHATNKPENGNGGNAAQQQGQGQAQGQAQGQIQGQGQAQAAIGGGIAGVKRNITNETRLNAKQSVSSSLSADNKGNVLTVNEAPIPAHTIQEIRQSDYSLSTTPDINMGNVFPTAPCMGSSQAGMSVTGFGLSFGTSWEAEECMIGETARGFEQAGHKVDAMHVRCQGKYAKAAPSCKAIEKAE